MKIFEYDNYIEIYDKEYYFHYNKPNYNKYNYLYLVKSLFELNIFIFKIGIRSCNLESNKKCLTKLKKIFGKDRVIFSGSYKQNIYTYRIIIFDDNEYKNFIECMINLKRENKLKRILNNE